MVGLDARALPIDRSVRRLKLLMLVGLAALAGLTAWEMANATRAERAADSVRCDTAVAMAAPDRMLATIANAPAAPTRSGYSSSPER